MMEEDKAVKSTCNVFSSMTLVQLHIEISLTYQLSVKVSIKFSTKVYLYYTLSNLCLNSYMMYLFMMYLFISDFLTMLSLLIANSNYSEALRRILMDLWMTDFLTINLDETSHTLDSIHLYPRSAIWGLLAQNYGF